MSTVIEEALHSFHAAIQKANSDEGAKKNTEKYREVLESSNGCGSPAGVVAALAPRLFDDTNAQGSSNGILRGNDALAVLSHLVETHPATYLVPTARAVREAVIRQTTKPASDELILAIAKLLVAYDDASGPAADASAALLEVCRRGSSGGESSSSPGDNSCRRVFRALAFLWCHLESLDAVARRKSSNARMRCASLVIDICLLGNDAMSCAMDTTGDEKFGTLADMLLNVAFDSSDPLMQMSGLDQLERLANGQPMHQVRAKFLVTNDALRRGLMDLTGGGCDGDGDENTCDGEGPDPINGGAALRLLSSICRTGHCSDNVQLLAVDGNGDDNFQRMQNKLKSLLSGLQRALHSFEPHGELERLVYVDAVSSFASASSKTATIAVDDPILREGWLSLSVSQPKLKSVILASLGSVIEPGILRVPGSHDNEGAISHIRPTDVMALQLYEALGLANGGRISTEIVLTSVQSPFMEERLGAYTLLRAVSTRGPGARLLLMTGGFFEWLTTRENEYTKEGREAKFLVVEGILSSEARGLLAENIVTELEKIKKEGPHFMPVSRELATE